MKPARFLRPLTATLILMLTAACAAPATHPDVPPEGVSSTRVSVHYLKPRQFTESHQIGFGHGYNHGHYLQKLKAHLIKQATSMLAPGQHLAVTITDIDLAGGFEPWLGPQWGDVRIMRDTYPPRIDLRFTLTGADGQTVRQGQRTLRGMSYLYASSALYGDSDPLRYDKALLDRWLRRDPADW